MAAETAIAFIGVSGTLIAACATPFVTAVLQDRRSKREARASRDANRTALVERAANSFIEARVKLDQALTGQVTQLDSAGAFIPMAQVADRLALEFGPEHDVARTYWEAVELWAKALNAAITTPSQVQVIADHRNASDERRKQFLAAAASELGRTEALEASARRGRLSRGNTHG